MPRCSACQQLLSEADQACWRCGLVLSSDELYYVATEGERLENRDHTRKAARQSRQPEYQKHRREGFKRVRSLRRELELEPAHEREALGVIDHVLKDSRPTMRGGMQAACAAALFAAARNHGHPILHSELLLATGLNPRELRPTLTKMTEEVRSSNAGSSLAEPPGQLTFMKRWLKLTSDALAQTGLVPQVEELMQNGLPALRHLLKVLGDSVPEPGSPTRQMAYLIMAISFLIRRRLSDEVIHDICSKCPLLSCTQVLKFIRKVRAKCTRLVKKHSAEVPWFSPVTDVELLGLEALDACLELSRIAGDEVGQTGTKRAKRRSQSPCAMTEGPTLAPSKEEEESIEDEVDSYLRTAEEVEAYTPIWEESQKHQTKRLRRKPPRNDMDHL